MKTDTVVVIVLDGVGIGELPDAALYRDEGSNTLANTARAVGGLHLPNLQSWGLGNIGNIPGVPPAITPRASYGRMAERSKGKDSTTGHWELAGLPVEKDFPYFPHGFPPGLIERFLQATGCTGILGNVPASGTVIIQELGEEHLRTGYPIVYTSADSVFQIAAHEEVIPVKRLYEICETTRRVVCIGDFAVGRVIARPFVGSPGSFSRTRNRKDFSLEPPGETLLDLLHRHGINTIGIGKIDDLFANRGLSQTNHTRSNADGIDALLTTIPKVNGGLILANLGDFDTLYGHRNDPEGFARALAAFDEKISALEETLRPSDLLIVTADHGNDPVSQSTDHSREYVPLLCYRTGGQGGENLGIRTSFADVAKTIAHRFGIDNTLAGASFLAQLGGEK